MGEGKERERQQTREYESNRRRHNVETHPNKGDRGPDRPRKARPFTNFSPLTTGQAMIYSLHKNDHHWKRPERMKAENRDWSHWCEFHSDPGHTTAECVDLKNDMEGLLRRGYYGRYRADRDRREGVERQNQRDEPAREVINVISGGKAPSPPLGGRNYLRRMRLQIMQLETAPVVEDPP